MKLDIKRLYSAIGKVLSENEYKIIYWRYGLENSQRKTQSEVADILGISRSYVSRIEKKALKKLKNALN